MSGKSRINSWNLCAFTVLFFCFFFKSYAWKNAFRGWSCNSRTADPLNNEVTILLALITSPGQIPARFYAFQFGRALSSCLTPDFPGLTRCPCAAIFRARIFESDNRPPSRTRVDFHRNSLAESQTMYPLRQPFLVSSLIDYMDINASDFAYLFSRSLSCLERF